PGARMFPYSCRDAPRRGFLAFPSWAPCGRNDRYWTQLSCGWGAVSHDLLSFLQHALPIWRGGSVAIGATALLDFLDRAEHGFRRGRRMQVSRVTVITDCGNGVLDRMQHGHGQHDRRFADGLGAVNRFLQVVAAFVDFDIEMRRQVTTGRNLVGRWRMCADSALVIPP